MLDVNGFKVDTTVEIATREGEVVQRLACLLWHAMEDDDEPALAWRDSETEVIISINHRFTELFGWTLEELQALEPYTGWLHPNDLPMALEIGESDGSFPYSARFAMKAGGYKRVFVQSVTILIANVKHRITVFWDD